VIAVAHVEKLFYRSNMRGCGLDSSGLSKGPVVDTFKHDNKPLISTKAGNFSSS
jgi:hypothetical protein